MCSGACNSGAPRSVLKPRGAGRLRPRGSTDRAGSGDERPWGGTRGFETRLCYGCSSGELYSGAPGADGRARGHSVGGGQQCGGQAGGSRPPRTRRRPREEQEGSEGADVLGGGRSRKRQKADTLGEFLSRKMYDAEEATQRRCSRCTCRISLRSSGGRAHARTQHAPYCLRRLPKDTAGRPLEASRRC